jgi:hypothetical protein
MERVDDMKAFWILECVLILTNVPTSHAQQLKWGDPNYKSVVRHK